MVASVAWPFRRPSIALRLTVWYALSALALIFLATGFLYWVLVTNLEREDNQELADNLANVRLLLQSSASGASPVRADETLGWPQQREPQMYLRILDDSARILVETPGMSRELPPPTVAALAALPQVDRLSRQVISGSGKLFQTLAARVNGEGAAAPVRFVQVAMDRANDEHVLVQYRERLWLVLSLSVFVCALIGYVIARGGMRPIEHIGQTAERIRSTTLHERIATAGLPAELSGLAETFNTMLDRLEESFARVSQFSDDVAHELRTPVNNLRGEIEVALSKARPQGDYRDVLGSCLEECTRISRVIQSLLFLARAENATDALQRDQVNVGRELAAVQEFYGAAASEAGVGLGVSVAPDLEARLDRTLFQQAISNLMSNAIAHTPPGGSVAITAHVEAECLRVTVIDNGCGISAENLPRVLDRFYRADRARSGSTHNVGLGLAVVKGIVERHRGRIEIDSEVGRGTRVEITLAAS